MWEARKLLAPVTRTQEPSGIDVVKEDMLLIDADALPCAMDMTSKVQ
jgi:hypothetical protein